MCLILMPTKKTYVLQYCILIFNIDTRHKIINFVNFGVLNRANKSAKISFVTNFFTLSIFKLFESIISITCQIIYWLEVILVHIFRIWTE